MDQLRISGKNLGQLALPTFCPRCFWVRMRCGEKLPFQVFPGIFSTLDNYQKKITDLHHRRHGTIPHWFGGFGDLGVPIEVPHFTRFNFVDAATDIMLTGVPDEMFRQAGGSLFISDNKTARFTGHQDDLLPMYRVQLNAYAAIADRIGLGPVTGLGLIYHEPLTDINDGNLDFVCGAEGVTMRFVAKLLAIDLQPEMIPPLLRRVREICDEPTAPAGRDGCKDCQRLDRLAQVC